MNLSQPPINTSRLCGIGLRSTHYQAMHNERPPVGWLEVHPENYFCGGMHLHILEKTRELYPVSFHAVGLSLGSDKPVNNSHLAQLKSLCERFDPVRVSDHASWSASGNAHLNDLLPLPYHEESLTALCRNIDQVQNVLGRAILIENPSSYLTYRSSTMSEAEFLTEAAKQSGCGLLLDINNIYVQSHNHGLNAHHYMAQIPTALVQEMHLAGHTQRTCDGGTLLIDTHNQPVCDAVWELYDAAIERFGNVPTLIEWDKDLPALDVLVSEAHKAENMMIRRHHHEAA